MDEYCGQDNKAGENALIRQLKNMKETMYKLRKKGALVDVVLYCGNLIGFAENRITAHKVILASCSPFFFSKCTEEHTGTDLSSSTSITNISLMLEKEKRNTGMKKIEIPDVDVATMEVIIEFMYTGRLSLSSKNHPAIGKTMIAARKLKVDELYRRCSKILTQGLSANNCIDLWDIADKCHDDALANRVVGFLADRFSVCYKSSRYMVLDLNRFKKVISTVLNSKQSPEEVILRCIFNWVQHDRFIRELCIQDVLKCCLLPSVSDRIISCIVDKDLSMDVLPELREEMRNARHKKILQLEMSGDKNSEYSSPSSPTSQTRLVRRFTSAKRESQHCLHPPSNSVQQDSEHVKVTIDASTQKTCAVSPKLPPCKMLCICQNRTGTNYLQTFDLSQDEWDGPISIPQMSLPSNACIAESQECMFVMGGVSKTGEKLNTCFRLVLKDLEWTIAPPMKVKKSHASAFGLSDCIFIVGGESKYGTSLGNVERFDRTAQVWRMLPSMRKARRSATVQALSNGRVYVMGGYNGAEWIVACEFYDPVSRCWTEISPLPGHEFSVAELCSGLHDNSTISVMSSRRPRSIAFYDWEIGAWRRETERVGVPPSSPRVIVTFGDQIYVIDLSRRVYIYYLHTHVWERVADVPCGDSKLLCAILIGSWNETIKEPKTSPGRVTDQPSAGDSGRTHAPPVI